MRIYYLSDRQLQMLDGIRSGSTNKEIATKYCLSLRTVESHVADILSITGCRNRTALTAIARHLFKSKSQLKKRTWWNAHTTSNIGYIIKKMDDIDIIDTFQLEPVKLDFFRSS